MSFIPQTLADPAAVLGSLRVGFTNSVHANERIVDVLLDTSSDLTHQSAVYANAGFLSGLALQQSLATARTCRDVWVSIADHNARLHEAYFKYLGECFSARHRALDRINQEDGYAAC